jgi:cation transport ATPase
MPILPIREQSFAGKGVQLPAWTQAHIEMVVFRTQELICHIVSLVLFGKATHRKMIQNLIWATGYNVVALPLAAGVLYRWGILLSPAAGAGLMAVSTIVVATNASMLRVKKTT